MMLHIYSDAFYISEQEAQSRARRYFFLGPNSKTTIQEMPPQNGPVHVEFSIMRNVMESATESELGGLFENFQKEISTRTSIADMGHLQPPTSVTMDNTAANIIFNRTAKQKILDK